MKFIWRDINNNSIDNNSANKGQTNNIINRMLISVRKNSATIFHEKKRTARKEHILWAEYVYQHICPTCEYRDIFKFILKLQ